MGGWGKERGGEAGEWKGGGDEKGGDCRGSGR